MCWRALMQLSTQRTAQDTRSELWACGARHAVCQDSSDTCKVPIAYAPVDGNLPSYLVAVYRVGEASAVHVFVSPEILQQHHGSGSGGRCTMSQMCAPL